MTQRPKARVFAVLTVILSALLLSVTGPAFAQTDTTVNPNVVISFPHRSMWCVGSLKCAAR